jgi:hypothetical protein
MPTTTYTRPSLLARFQRWMARRNAAMRLAGLEEALYSVDDELASLEAVAFYPTYQAAAWAQTKTDMLNRERESIERECREVTRLMQSL